VAAVAAERGVQSLVFPELSLMGYELALARANALQPDSPVLQPFRDFAKDVRMMLVAGAPLLTNDNGIHIAALAFCPDGAVSIYTKVYVHESEQHVFTCGPGGPELLVEDATVALAICADAKHPQHERLIAWSRYLCRRCHDHRGGIRAQSEPPRKVCGRAQNGCSDGELQRRDGWLYLRRQECDLV
jgi:predicted amidohydrolase